MAYIFSANYEYKDKCYQIDIQEAVNRFPFIADKTISGEILATYIDNKVVLVKEPFECQAIQSQQQSPRWMGIVGELNPLKKRGIPPCQLCVALYKYHEKPAEKANEFPIMENETIKGNTYNFDDVVKKILKEQEIRIIIESTIFHPELAQLVTLLRDSQIAFEEERYPDTKTSCRKIIENLRAKSKDWETIDGSGSVSEKISKIMDIMFSFASVGGPHGGLNTKDETELILKTVAALFSYINTLMKNDRIGVKVGNNSG